MRALLALVLVTIMAVLGLLSFPPGPGSVASAASAPAPAALGGGRVVVSLPLWENRFDWPSGDGYVAWESSGLAPRPLGWSFALGRPGQPGLWAWVTRGRQGVVGTAEWRYDAPGTTRIASARLSAEYGEELLSDDESDDDDDERRCLLFGLGVGGEHRSLDRRCVRPGEDDFGSVETTSDDNDEGEGSDDNEGSDEDDRSVLIADSLLSDPDAAPRAKQLVFAIEATCEGQQQHPCDNDQDDGDGDEDLF